MIDQPFTSFQEDQAAWNISSGVANQIEWAIVKADRHWLEGELSDCYHTWSLVRLKINPNLKKEEREKLDGIEKTVSKLIRKWIESGETRKTKNELGGYVKVYQRQIMDLLKKLGYITIKKDRAEMNF